MFCFFISSIILQHNVHGARLFHSHQLAGMCNTVQAVRVSMRRPMCAQPPWSYAATCAWVHMLIRMMSVDVDFCNAVLCWVNLWVAFHFCIVAVFVSWRVCGSCHAQRWVLYIYHISGASFLPRCLTGSTKWESMQRNPSSQARHADVIGNSRSGIVK